MGAKRTPRGNAVQRFYQTVLVAISTALALVSSLPACGAERPWSIRHYQHTTYTQKDGAPLLNGVAIGQTSDGYLWMVGIKGIVRFDGLHFLPFVARPGEQLLSDEIRAMFGPKTGGLWIAYEAPGISFVKDGHIKNYVKNDGWPGGTADFFEDRNGDIVAFAYPGLMKLVRDKWVRIDDEASDLQIDSATQDEAFNFWATTSKGDLLVRPDGARNFKSTGLRFPGAFRIKAIGTDNLFVFSRDNKIHRLRTTSGSVREVGSPIPIYGHQIVMDRHHNFWVGTTDEGIHFLDNITTLPVEATPLPTGVKIDTDHGLTGNFAAPFLDRDGNVWVATEGGLDRFSPSAFSRLDLPKGINELTLAPGADGDMWVGSEAHNVIHYVNDVPVDTAAPRAAMSMHANPATHEVLAATADELWQLAPGTPHSLAKLPESGIGVVLSVTQDAIGTPWIAYVSNTGIIATLKDGSWLPQTAVTSGRYVFADGPDIWIGFDDNRATVYRYGAWTTYDAKQGVSVGSIKVFARNHDGLWLGGDHGVQVFDGKVFHVLHLAGKRSLTDVSGLAFDQHGSLWIHALDGLYAISAHAIDRFLAGDDTPLPFRRFSSEDGVPGVPAQTHTLPSLVRASDGRLWISGQNAAAWFDPDDMPVTPPASAPVIERLNDGKHDVDLTQGSLRLAKDARNLVITYATPDLSNALKVRYQYRLQGFDEHWQDAGPRREAIYQHLPAGMYQFEVRSSTDGTNWTNVPTRLSFSIAPTFVETALAKVLAAVASFGLLWLILRLRVSSATRAIRRQAQIRADEREAVARDIHDTLLQHAQGLALQLEALSKDAGNVALSDRLNKLSLTARQAAADGRDKVSVLRASADTSKNPFADMLEEASSMAFESNVRFHVEVVGTPYLFKPEVIDDLEPLLRELLRNAFYHSNAKTVSLNLKYGHWFFLATVCDDGIGLAKDAMKGLGLEGHWGIRGVLERAARLGGRVEFLPAASGTCVQFEARKKRLSADSRWL